MTAIKVTGALKPRYDEILSSDALAFLEALHTKFNATRLALLDARQERQKSSIRARCLIFSPRQNLCAKALGR